MADGRCDYPGGCDEPGLARLGDTEFCTALGHIEWAVTAALAPGSQLADLIRGVDNLPVRIADRLRDAAGYARSGAVLARLRNDEQLASSCDAVARQAEDLVLALRGRARRERSAS